MIDKETIGKMFESAVGSIAPTYLAEAETDEYPFIVYSQLVSPRLTKDGEDAIESQLEAVIVADDPNVAENIAESVATAMNDGMTGYSVFPRTLERDCTNGIWEISLTWTVRQHIFTSNSSGSGSGN